MLRRSAYVALFLGLLGASACTATATAGPPAGGCGTDSTVQCVAGTGYSCSGASQPEDADADLVCSTDGAGDFCCSHSTCTYDSSVACVSGAIGYSCATGATPPDEADPTLVCSEPTSANNVNTYCCYTNTITPPSGATCAQDQSVTGCTANSSGNPAYGFSCTGTDTPDQDFSNITCSTGTPASGTTDYCCVYN